MIVDAQHGPVAELLFVDVVLANAQRPRELVAARRQHVQVHAVDGVDLSVGLYSREQGALAKKDRLALQPSRVKGGHAVSTYARGSEDEDLCIVLDGGKSWGRRGSLVKIQHVADQARTRRLVLA